MRKTAKLVARMQGSGAEPAGDVSPAQVQNKGRVDLERWRRVVEKPGSKVQ